MTNQYYTAAKGAQKTVQSLIEILKKLETQIATKSENDIETYQEWETTIIEARLIDDMFPLKKQITIISDNLKGIFARLSNNENPKMEDNETTLAQLIERLEKTVAFADSTDPASFENAETIKIQLPMIPGKFMTASDYVVQFAIPNIYFHLAIAYGIIRSRGYKIGKMDFIGQMNLHDL
jgi:uncharacterized protein